MRLLLLAAALAAPASAAPAPADWNPDAIVWQRTNPDGTRFALLEGVRDTSGKPFSYAFFIPAGVWDTPHWHSADARVFVARGVLHLGYGDRLDRASARAFHLRGLRGRVSSTDRRSTQSSSAQ